jgi:hypothetical protein
MNESIRKIIQVEHKIIWMVWLLFSCMIVSGVGGLGDGRGRKCECPSVDG